MYTCRPLAPSPNDLTCRDLTRLLSVQGVSIIRLPRLDDSGNQTPPPLSRPPTQPPQHSPTKTLAHPPTQPNRSIHPSTCDDPSNHPTVYTLTHQSIHTYTHTFTHSPSQIFIYPSIHPFIHLPFIYPSIHSSIYHPSIHLLTIHPSTHLRIASLNDVLFPLVAAVTATLARSCVSPTSFCKTGRQSCCLRVVIIIYLLISAVVVGGRPC